MKVILIRLGFALLIGAYLIGHPSQGAECAQSPQQLKDLLHEQQLNPSWADYIQGHWSVKPKGTGFHIITHKGRYVFAIAPLPFTRDAKYIKICKSKHPGHLFVSGKVLGRSTDLEVFVQGDNLVVDSKMTKGVFVKRSKSIEQIRAEFADLLRLL
jgi:hypothetical protein